MRLCEEIADERIIVGIDVAKVDQYAAVMRTDLSVVQTVRWRQPNEQGDFVELVSELASAAEELPS